MGRRNHALTMALGSRRQRGIGRGGGIEHGEEAVPIPVGKLDVLIPGLVRQNFPSRFGQYFSSEIRKRPILNHGGALNLPLSVCWETKINSGLALCNGGHCLYLSFHGYKASAMALN